MVYSSGPNVPGVLEFCGYVPQASGASALRLSVGGMAVLLLVCTSAVSVPFTSVVVAWLGFATRQSGTEQGTLIYFPSARSS